VNPLEIAFVNVVSVAMTDNKRKKIIYKNE
jgi:hypothetical protein